jgi:hypothetical protein
VQEKAALPVVRLSQIQVESAGSRFGRQAEPSLLPQQFLLERDHRRLIRHLAQPLADD